MARSTIFLFLLAASAAAGAGVLVTHSRSTDFSTFETYSWADGTPAPSSRSEKLIREAVDLELQSRGLTKATGAADLVVATHASSRAEAREDVDILDRPQDVDAAEGVWPDPNRRQMEMGRLVIELTDGASGLQVWRAVATEIFELDPEKSPKRGRKRIFRIVDKMFRDFPPG